MLFFLFSLAVSLLVTGILVALLGKSLIVNWERKNRRPLSYLTPVLLTLVLLYISMTQAVPRVLDVVTIFANTCTVEEVVARQEGIHWQSLDVGGRKFYYNQWQYQFNHGRTYRISYTPRSHYIIEVTEIVEPITKN